LHYGQTGNTSQAWNLWEGNCFEKKRTFEVDKEFVWGWSK
jgi:hypothetical protein